MPRATSNKLYRTFVKGLITEADPLTYPENASIDEDNCILSRRGNRTRRLGVDFEEGFTLSQYAVSTENIKNYAVKEFKWESVSNTSTLNFLVIQVGLRLYFYDLSFDPLVDGLKTFVLDLTTFIVPGSSNPTATEVSFSTGKGYLFVVGAKIEPLIIEYLLDQDDILVTPIVIAIRDFKGVDDGLANDEEPTTLSVEHQYNLLNQGWISPNQNQTSGVVSNVGNTSAASGGFGGRGDFTIGESRLVNLV